LLRILAPQRRSPSDLMKDLNEALLERKVDAQYATLSLITWAAKTRTFTVVSAGTLPPMLCRHGQIIEFEVEGVPIGLLEGQQYDQVTIAAEPKDFLLLYSDGVEDQLGKDAAAVDEATASEKEMETYGRHRLEKVLKANHQLSPQQVAEKVFADIDKFRGATVLTDDQSIVALRVR
jgi:sigma-B regulation protein RsbU (phosphoserine phosphatase)